MFLPLPIQTAWHREGKEWVHLQWCGRRRHLNDGGYVGNNSSAGRNRSTSCHKARDLRLTAYSKGCGNAGKSYACQNSHESIKKHCSPCEESFHARGHHIPSCNDGGQAYCNKHYDGGRYPEWWCSYPWSKWRNTVKYHITNSRNWLTSRKNN